MPVEPDPNKTGRPGHNGGGWLKSGNSVGVGRKPADVRLHLLKTVDEGMEVMRSILDGEFRQPVRDMFGKVVGYRGATIIEVATVWEKLAKHALPLKTELTGKDGGAIELNATPDLSGLSREEKETMYALAEKAEAARQENPQ